MILMVFELIAILYIWFIKIKQIIWIENKQE